VQTVPEDKTGDEAVAPTVEAIVPPLG